MIEGTNESMIVRKVIEQVQTFKENLTIENIVIDGRQYNLQISNPRHNNGYLHLDFLKKRGEGYRISIDEKGIRFTKMVYDDGDCESTAGLVDKNLIVGISDNPIMGLKKGETYWLERFPRQNEEDYLRVEFEDKK